jgi:hypothetical protein
LANLWLVVSGRVSMIVWYLSISQRTTSYQLKKFNNFPLGLMKSVFRWNEATICFGFMSVSWFATFVCLVWSLLTSCSSHFKAFPRRCRRMKSSGDDTFHGFLQGIWLAIVTENQIAVIAWFEHGIL